MGFLAQSLEYFGQLFLDLRLSVGQYFLFDSRPDLGADLPKDFKGHHRIKIKTLEDHTYKGLKL